MARTKFNRVKSQVRPIFLGLWPNYRQLWYTLPLSPALLREECVRDEEPRAAVDADDDNDEVWGVYQSSENSQSRRSHWLRSVLSLSLFPWNNYKLCDFFPLKQVKTRPVKMSALETALEWPRFCYSSKCHFFLSFFQSTETVLRKDVLNNFWYLQTHFKIAILQNMSISVCIH